MAKNKKFLRRLRIRRGVRSKIRGTADRPRLSVFRSNGNIYAQIINDDEGRTLAAASSLDKDLTGELEGKKRAEAGVLVGERLAERAKEAGIEEVVFDRNGYLYHGRVKALADGVRKGGLKL